MVSFLINQKYQPFIISGGTLYDQTDIILSLYNISLEIILVFFDFEEDELFIKIVRGLHI